jgi:hypothetical protein
MPRASLRRVLLHALLSAATALSVTACGGPEGGENAALVRAVAGDLLVLRGAPREQGRQQGRVLKPEILALHEQWQRAALARDGDLLSAATRERRAGLLRLVDEVERRLPEAARQELDGLAEGCGLPARTLLLTEVMTDLLRFGHGEAALLTGALAWDATARRARIDLEGPWADLLATRLLWIRRERAGAAPCVTVLAWPGSLGGLIAVRRDGLALLALETPLDAGRQSLAGVPFRLGLRLAAERAADATEALALLPRTTAQRVLAVDLAAGAAQSALLALAGEDAPPATSARADGPGRPRAHGVAWIDGAPALLGWLESQDAPFVAHAVP